MYVKFHVSWILTLLLTMCSYLKAVCLILLGYIDRSHTPKHLDQLIRLVLFTFKCCWSSCIPTGQKTTSPSRFDLLCILWKMLRDLTDIKLQYMLVSQLGSAVCLRSRPKSTRDRIEVKQKAGLLFWLLENVGTKWQWWKLNYNLNWES